MKVSRRDFVKSALLSTAIPGLFTRSASAELGTSVPRPLVIFLELKGGNDFLSTLVPYSNDDYRKLRPTLHLTEKEVLPLNDQLGFHRSLKLFSHLYQKKELAILQGLGYENQSFSHFKSLDNWESGSTGNEFFYDGWAARALRKMSSEQRFVDAIGLGVTGAGPARGLEKKIFILENPERFLSSYELQKIIQEKNPGISLAHILNIQENINETFYRMKQLPSMKDINFSGEPFIVTVRVIKKILSGIPGLPYLKFTHEGYDTHSGQKLTHDKLMKDLNDGLTDLITFLKENNLWTQTLLVTYSEFGRSPMENFSGGTDHGGSSCHFVMGGRIKGGLYGEYPAFREISDFQFKPTADYRMVFSEIVEDFWKVNSKAVFNKTFKHFSFLKA